MDNKSLSLDTMPSSPVSHAERDAASLRWGTQRCTSEALPELIVPILSPPGSSGTRVQFSQSFQETDSSYIPKPQIIYNPCKTKSPTKALTNPCRTLVRPSATESTEAGLVKDADCHLRYGFTHVLILDVRVSALTLGHAWARFLVRRSTLAKGLRVWSLGSSSCLLTSVMAPALAGAITVST